MGDESVAPLALEMTTPATRFLHERGILFNTHRYNYVEKGGTGASSRALGVEEHRVVKTLVFEDRVTGRPFIVLMHGDQRVDSRALAAQLGVKRVAACSAETAEAHTGYQVGGTSPFGTTNMLPIYVERSIVSLDDKRPTIYINGGQRGFLLSLDPADLSILNPTLVDVAIEKPETVQS